MGEDLDVMQPGLLEFRTSFLISHCVRVSIPGEWLSDAGVRIDDWECVPQMQVVTRPVTHYRDDAAGFLNILSKLTFSRFPFE